MPIGGKRRLHLAVLSTYDVLMTRLPTWRWLVTRLELTLAVGCNALAALSFISAPNYMQPMYEGGGLAHWEVGVKVTAVMVMPVATLWMFRNSPHKPDAGTSYCRFGRSVYGRI